MLEFTVKEFVAVAKEEDKNSGQPLVFIHHVVDGPFKGFRRFIFAADVHRARRRFEESMRLALAAKFGIPVHVARPAPDTPWWDVTYVPASRQLGQTCEGWFNAEGSPFEYDTGVYYLEDTDRVNSPSILSLCDDQAAEIEAPQPAVAQPGRDFDGNGHLTE